MALAVLAGCSVEFLGDELMQHPPVEHDEVHQLVLSE